MSFTGPRRYWNLSGVREEVPNMGYKEQTHYIKIRPEEREDGVQIRADVKGKMGEGFRRSLCGNAH